MSNVFNMNGTERLTAAQAIEKAKAREDEFDDVIIIGYDTDGSLIIMSSYITNEAATFLLAKGIQNALCGGI